MYPGFKKVKFGPNRKTFHLCADGVNTLCGIKVTKEEYHFSNVQEESSNVCKNCRKVILKA